MEEIEPTPEFDPESNQPSTLQWVVIGIIGFVALCGFLLFVSGIGFTIFSFSKREQAQAEETAIAATEVVVNREQAKNAASEWPIVLFDTFDDNQSEWIDGEIDDEYSTIQVTINGVYKWEATAKQGFAWRVWPESDLTTDFYLAVDAQNLGNNIEAQYGLIFRENDGDYFYWEIIDTQNFRFFFYQNEWVELIPSTYTEAIQPGEINHLVVLSENDEFQFWINDQYVGQASGSVPSSGKAGVAIGLSYNGEESTIVFDNFELRALTTVE